MAHIGEIRVEGMKAEHDLTPSEIALARVLAAWEAWAPEDGDNDASDALDNVTDALDDAGLIDVSVEPFVLNARARNMIARARKAGAL